VYAINDEAEGREAPSQISNISNLKSEASHGERLAAHFSSNLEGNGTFIREEV
jgi:hypothetical protein